MQQKKYQVKELIVPTETACKIVELAIPQVSTVWCDHATSFLKQDTRPLHIQFAEGNPLCFRNMFYGTYFVLTPGKLTEGVSVCAQLGLLTIYGKTVTEDCIHKTVARSILEHALFRGGNYQ